MKNNWVWVVIALVVVVAVGYAGKNRIKSLLRGYTPAPVVTTTTPSPSAAPSGDLVMTKTDTTKGKYLVGANGMTLYIFDKDQPGVSNCNDTCTSVWPPYLKGAAGGVMPANMTAIKRADGSMQYAWNGLPLYYYSKDKQVGDILGDGFNGVWHLVKP